MVCPCARVCWSRLEEPGEVASLILQRTPKLPPHERSVSVSHELHDGEEPELLRRVTVDGLRVDIETTTRRYLLDVFGVGEQEAEAAIEVPGRAPMAALSST